MKAKTLMQNIIIVMVIFAGLLACQNTSPPIESLYNQMTQENIIEFYGFPEALKSIEGEKTGIILANEKDTLQLVSCYPNMADTENRYPQYLLADNHNNWWTLTREGDMYKLYNHTLVVPQKNWVKPFCGGGVYFAIMLAIFLFFKNFTATNEKEKISINNIIKLILLAFFIGGCVGLAIML